MKLIHHTPLPKRFIKRKKRGFALIATLTLMMLLTLIAVGLLALASSQTRIAQYTVLQAEARQQALVGLDAAIAELQLEMGPDQRVSANSGIVQMSEGASTPHVLGVWDSWDGPIYGSSRSGHGNSIQSTYQQGRPNMFRRWLISTRDVKASRDFKSSGDLAKRRPGRRVCLVGTGTLGSSNSVSRRDYIYADLLTMPSTGSNEACFAWWICGENQKAKAGVVDPEETNDAEEVLHRTWNTPGPIFSSDSIGAYLNGDMQRRDAAKILSLQTIVLMGAGNLGEGTPFFFDVTTSSHSLITNVRDGGLKTDLCLLLNKKSLSGTPYAGDDTSDRAIATEAPGCSEPNFPIGSWQTLHAYYNTWPDGSASDGKNFTARLIGTLDNAYTRMSGCVTDASGQGYSDPDETSVSSSTATYYSNRSMLDQGSKSAGYGRTPVILAFMNNFGLVTEELEGKMTTDEKEPDQAYKLSLCFAPMFLWWNPYNVPMKVRGEQLWSHSAPYKTTWIQTYAITQAGTWNYTWSRYAMDQGSSDTQLGQDLGDYFLKSSNDRKGDIVFEPGEILFFSPAKARITSEYDRAFMNPWAIGYHPANVAGYKAKFYSNAGGKKDDPGISSETNINAGKFYLELQMGLTENGTAPRTDGYFFSPQRAECVTVMNGFNGSDATNYGVGGYGKRAHSPQYFILGWYDPSNPGTSTVFCDADRNNAVWSTDGTQSDPSVPYYVAALGIAAKSANPNLDSRIFSGRDFRGKIWQHSSPAFYGSMIVNPDDQYRQYHPYQLAALDVGSGLTASPMDNIGDNGVLGITSDGEQVSYASVLELPVHPPFSLAGFAGMRLQPGWYKSGGALSQRRRMQYQCGVPGVGIGNSFADPCLPADDVYVMNANNIPTSGSANENRVNGNGRIFQEFYDHGLLINDALWDTWFCSSVSDMPTSREGGMKAKKVLEAFMSGTEDLPVARYRKISTPYDQKAIVKRIMDDDGWKYIAQYLIIDGGFNVNSTSVEAWKAVLQGLARRQLVSNAGGRLSVVKDGDSQSEVLFSRFMVSTSDKSIDSLGSYSPMQGSTSLRRGGQAAAWGEIRKLDESSIAELAEKIVEEVKKRGPFLSMSDFINRRLDSSNKDGAALKGALQAAIDATDINRDFQEVQVKPASGSLYKFKAAEEGSLHTAAPGYLIQSDVLASLGNILTVRDDTFVVRSFGCVRNADGIILAQAWCEAVVQRSIDYVDPSNSPTDVDKKRSDPNRPSGSGEKDLSDINKVMGRKFRVVSFKWLDVWDI